MIPPPRSAPISVASPRRSNADAVPGRREPRREPPEPSYEYSGGPPHRSPHPRPSHHRPNQGGRISLSIATARRRSADAYVERDGADGALDGVVVDFDPAIIEEEAETGPARQCVADCLGEFGLLTDQRQLFPQPGLEGFNQRKSALLANG